MTDKLRIGTWNMERDRGAGVAQQAILLARRFDLDALCLNESGDYVAALRRYVLDNRDEWLLLTGSRPGESNTAILVNRRVRATHREQLKATQNGWITVRGGTTLPKYVPAIRLDGWLRLAAVHLPPSTWRTRRFGGPWRRRRAYRQHMSTLRAWGRRRVRQYPRDTLMMVGDWNAQPNARGWWSPDWLRRSIPGGRFNYPPSGSLGRRIIDYAILRLGPGHRISRAHPVNNAGGSDHDLVWWEVSRP